jgi:hypothetical protein
MSRKKWLAGFAIISLVLYIVFEGEEAFEDSSFSDLEPLDLKTVFKGDNLEERDGTHFECPVWVKSYYERGYNWERERFETKNKSVRDNDRFYNVTPDPYVGQMGNETVYEPDPWKRAGSTWLLTLYPPDKVKIHHHAKWYRWGNGAENIKGRIDHRFMELRWKNAIWDISELEASQGEFYDFRKEKLIFNRVNFLMGERGSLVTKNTFNEIYSDIWECKIIDEDTLKAKIQEHENRLIIDEKIIKETEDRLRSRSKI